MAWSEWKNVGGGRELIASNIGSVGTYTYDLSSYTHIMFEIKYTSTVGDIKLHVLPKNTPTVKLLTEKTNNVGSTAYVSYVEIGSITDTGFVIVGKGYGTTSDAAYGYITNVWGLNLG